MQEGFHGPICGLQNHLLYYTGDGRAIGATCEIPSGMYSVKTFAAPFWCPLRNGSFKVYMGVEGMQATTTEWTPEEEQSIDEQNERDYAARQQQEDDNEDEQEA